jgi:hypothetical protein
MNDLLEILAIIAFIAFGLLGGKKKKRPQQTRPPRPLQPRAAPGTSRAGVPTSQDNLLQELENLFTGRVSSPPRRLPPPEEPTEAVSLEPVGGEETARWEAGLERASKVRETAAWEEGLHRDAGSLETLEAAGEASHARFHQRYEPSTVPRIVGPEGPTFRANDLRRAFVWSEVLGAPVSMREQSGRDLA